MDMGEVLLTLKTTNMKILIENFSMINAKEKSLFVVSVNALNFVITMSYYSRCCSG